jgi:oxygen-independent coproporphyrinogen-3 oxidase
VTRRFGVDFDRYFAPELERLESGGGAAADGLVELTGDALVVTARGRLFVRTVCMVFDRYLATPRATPTFSRTI